MFKFIPALSLLLLSASSALADPCEPLKVYVSATPQPLTADTISDALGKARRLNACRLVVHLDSGVYEESLLLDRPVEVLSVSAGARPVIRGSIFTQGHHFTLAGVDIERGSIDVPGGKTRVESVDIRGPAWGMTIRGGDVTAHDLGVFGATEIAIHVVGKASSFDAKGLRVVGAARAGVVFAEGARGWIYEGALTNNAVCGLCAFSGSAVLAAHLDVVGVFSDALNRVRFTNTADSGGTDGTSGGVVLEPVPVGGSSSSTGTTSPGVKTPPPPPPEEEPKDKEPRLLPSDFNIFTSDSTLVVQKSTTRQGEVGFGARQSAVAMSDSAIIENYIGLTVDLPENMSCFTNTILKGNLLDQPFEEMPIPSAPDLAAIREGSVIGPDLSHCPVLPWNI